MEKQSYFSENHTQDQQGSSPRLARQSGALPMRHVPFSCVKIHPHTPSVPNLSLTLYQPSFLIYFFTQLKLCLATATHNFNWVKIIHYLFNLTPNIYKSWCLKTNFVLYICHLNNKLKGCISRLWKVIKADIYSARALYQASRPHRALCKWTRRRNGCYW